MLRLSLSIDLDREHSFQDNHLPSSCFNCLKIASWCGDFFDQLCNFTISIKCITHQFILPDRSSTGQIMTIAVCEHCFGLSCLHSYYNARLYSRHGWGSIIALATNFQKSQIQPQEDVSNEAIDFSASVDSTWYWPTNSSFTLNFFLTHQRQTTTCSIFAASVVSSSITV